MSIKIKDFIISKISKKEREQAEKIVLNTLEFNERDKRTCLYVFDGIEKGEYEGLGIFEKEKLLGFILFSENSLSENVFELLWIVIDPQFYGSGVAEILFNEFLKEVIRRRGRMIILETSERHKRARRFYEKMGFKLEAVIKDFYSPSENKEIWVKRFEDEKNT